MATSNHKTRIRLLIGGIFLVTLIFGGRLFFLQIVEGADYGELADRQYLRSARTFFDRGSIYFSDRDGSLVPAATLKQEFLVTMNPQLVNSPGATYDFLVKELTDLKKDEFLDLMKGERMYAEIADGVPKTVADNIMELDLKGVYVYKEKRRFYPAQRMASHVLGFMAYRGENYTGIYGLEKEYNKVLSHEEQGSFASFFAEIFLGFGDGVSAGVIGEGEVILSIEPMVQRTVEDKLKETIDKWQADAGGVIVMDPLTGEIIAMAALPDFHPGEKQLDIKSLPNPLVERVFEMGSIVKPLTMAAGINEGLVNANTTYYDSGQVVLNNRVIKNHDKISHGTVTMQEVINNSLNTGAVFVMQKLGKERFRDYFLEGYGLGDKTGVDLPGEVSSLVDNIKSRREVEYATASFGQGIALSPIAMTRAFGVLASGGKLVTPHVVKSIKYDIGVTKDVEVEIVKSDVISKKTTEEITQMLVKAVDGSLQGGTAKLAHYAVAAKTGTAQMSKGDGGGYYADRYLHSFAGYYPAYNPKFVTFMYLVNPRQGRYSSDTLTEPFMSTAEFLLNYYEVSPDRAGS